MINGPLVLSAGLALAVAAGPAGAQTPGSVDPATLGPQVGSTVPAFSLPDQNGKEQTSRSLMGPRGMMLVFSRATAW